METFIFGTMLLFILCGFPQEEYDLPNGKTLTVERDTHELRNITEWDIEYSEELDDNEED